jgi:hypothetical protein
MPNSRTITFRQLAVRQLQVHVPDRGCKFWTPQLNFVPHAQLPGVPLDAAHLEPLTTACRHSCSLCRRRGCPQHNDDARSADRSKRPLSKRSPLTHRQLATLNVSTSSDQDARRLTIGSRRPERARCRSTYSRKRNWSGYRAQWSPRLESTLPSICQVTQCHTPSTKWAAALYTAIERWRQRHKANKLIRTSKVERG